MDEVIGSNPFTSTELSGFLREFPITDHKPSDAKPTQFFDVIVLGAGGAGMFCAAQAGRRGRRVLLLDHAKQVGAKILISGGGRCNFTNIGASPAQYQSANPHFCKSALSRFRPEHFLELVQGAGISFHEKKLGQLFCDHSAREIVRLLEQMVQEAGVQTLLGCEVLSADSANRSNDAVGTPPGLRFSVSTSLGDFYCESLVVATGGLSIPKIGASGIGYRLARKFGLEVIDTAPALDGFVFEGSEAAQYRELAGLSLETVIHCGAEGKVSFRENILFTHSGLSGPAALQASLYWRPGQALRIDLLPGVDSMEFFRAKKKGGSRALVRSLLSELLPARLAEKFCEKYFPSTLPLPQVSEKALSELCTRLHAWEVWPSGTVGYSKAEVTRGGIDTQELSSKTLEAKKVPGLYFIGEVVDVTGWLGGYNLQWAWSSGWAAGQVA
jgi:predicted Rossmann fold flavoprotein